MKAKRFIFLAMLAAGVTAAYLMQKRGDQRRLAAAKKAGDNRDWNAVAH